MAVYRIHRKEWDKGFPRPSSVATTESRKRSIAQMDTEGQDGEDDADNAIAVSSKNSRTAKFPGGGRKGISSGLSVVVKRKETKPKSGWWKDLSSTSGRV